MTEYYRFESAERADGRVVLELRKFKEHKRTAKGAWIRHEWDREGHYAKFVLDGKGKRYAYPSEEDAMASFIIRKSRQIQHLKNTLTHAEAALRLAESGAQPEADVFSLL